MRPVIIDSGGANLASLQYALERLGVQAPVTTAPNEISAASHVILPGVGSAPDAMRRLQSAGIAAVLPRLEQPVLGICLGMQLLFARSEEGDTNCLGAIPGSVQRLQPQPGLPVPHMGWNQLAIRQRDPLLAGVPENEYVYFVHSYAAAVSDSTIATANYGTDVTAVVRRKNFCGTQFHPERSGPAGARILANFLGIQ
jgi:imidazole glycerol-phosphate synthase subunit HisH